MRNRLTLTLTAFVVASIPCSLANADELAGCSSSVSSSKLQPVYSSPTELVIGRSASISTAPSSELLSLTSSDPSLATLKSVGDGDWILASVGAVGVVTVSAVYKDWESKDAYPYIEDCQRVQTISIPITKGNSDPKVTVSKAEFEDNDVVVSIQRDCKTNRIGSTILRLTNGRATMKYIRSDLCSGEWQKEGTKKMRGLSTGLSVGGDESNLHIKMTSEKNYRVGLKYSVTVGGRVISLGRLRGRTEYEKGSTIWQGTDDFVNYCINSTRKILSSGGRLYCTEPSSVYRSWKLTS